MRKPLNSELAFTIAIQAPKNKNIESVKVITQPIYSLERSTVAFLALEIICYRYQKHSVPQPDIFPLCVIFAPVMFPAPVVRVALVALSIVVCANTESIIPRLDVSTHKMEIPVTNTMIASILEFFILLQMKRELLYKKIATILFVQDEILQSLTN